MWGSERAMMASINTTQNGIGATTVHGETMSFLRKTLASVNSAILTSKQCTSPHALA